MMVDVYLTRMYSVGDCDCERVMEMWSMSKLYNLELFWRTEDSLESESIACYNVLSVELDLCCQVRYHGSLRQEYGQGDTVSITSKSYIANNTVAL